MKKLATLALAAHVFSFGCTSSSPLVTSFADITSEADRQGILDGNQNRLISLAGMLLHGQPGQLLRYKVSRNPTTAVPLSGATDSQIVVRETGSTVTLRQVLDVRNKIIDARNAATTLVERKLDAAFLAAAIAAARARGDAPDDEILRSLEATRNSLGNAQSAFDKARDDAQKAINTDGIVVTRWTVKSKASGDLGIGNLLGVSGTAESSSSGFAVFGGLRTTQIELGADFKQAKSHIQGGFDVRWHWIPFRAESDDENVRLVTYTIETRHVAYAQDFSTSLAIGARVVARASELQKLGTTLKEADRIEIAATLARVEELSNMGVLGQVERRAYKRPWTSDPKNVGKADYEKFLKTYSASSSTEETANQSSGDVGGKKNAITGSGESFSTRKHASSGGSVR